VLTIDHVIVTVEDLDRAATRLYEQHGLASVAGGRHPGHGTGNRIVPLGETYIELMAVIDLRDAASSPMGSWVRRRVLEAGDAPAGLCLRTDDIEAVARRTGQSPSRMSRTRPDGVELTWHLAALEAAFSDGLPFFIQWHVAAGDHPGRAVVAHRVPAAGLAWVEMGGDHQRWASWLGPHTLPLRAVEGRPGPHRIAVKVMGGEPLVIG